MDKEDIKNIYDKIEDAVVDTYKRVEKAAVEGYQKVEDAAVEKLFAKEGETAQQAKSRLRGEAPTEIARIETEHAPAAIGPYSQAIDTGMGVVFVSGQLPIDPATGAFPEGGIQEIVNNLRTMKEMAINAANDHNTDLDRGTIEKEFASRKQTITDIAASTNYNGKLLLTGDYAEYQIDYSQKI